MKNKTKLIIYGVLLLIFVGISAFLLLNKVGKTSYALEQEVSGTYDGVDWKITTDGELIIGKEGETQTFDDKKNRYDSLYPWNQYKESIINVKFKSEVIGQGRMDQMFSGMKNVTSIDLNNFDTSNVTSMSYMFSYLESLNSIDLSPLNTSNVVDISGMFIGCKLLKVLDLSNFKTSNVIYISQMFYNCNNLTSIDLSSFDTSKVIHMHEMFLNCSSIEELDLSNFNTDNVYYMSYMFSGMTSLKRLNISSFNTLKSNRNDGYYGSANKEMFKDTDNLQEIIVGENTKLSLSGHDYYFWSKTKKIEDSVEGIKNINSAGTWYKVEDQSTCSSQYSKSGKYDGVCWEITDDNILKIGKEGFEQEFDNSERYGFPWFEYRNDIRKVEFVDKVIGNGGMMGMFYGFKNLVSIDLSKFDTSNVTDMSFMFDGASSLGKIDLSNFDTSKATNMEEMFRDTAKLESITIGEKTDLLLSGHSYFYWTKNNDSSNAVKGIKNINSVGTWTKIDSKCFEVTENDIPIYNAKVGDYVIFNHKYSEVIENTNEKTVLRRYFSPDVSKDRVFLRTYNIDDISISSSAKLYKNDGTEVSDIKAFLKKIYYGEGEFNNHNTYGDWIFNDGSSGIINDYYLVYDTNPTVHYYIYLYYDNVPPQSSSLIPRLSIILYASNQEPIYEDIKLCKDKIKGAFTLGIQKREFDTKDSPYNNSYSEYFEKNVGDVYKENFETMHSYVGKYYYDYEGNIIGLKDRYTGEIILNKKLAKAPIENVVFSLTGSNYYKELTTNASGEVFFDNLSPGKYRLKEKEAPEKYELNDTEYLVTVTSDGQVTIDNYESYGIEKNGEMFNIYNSPKEFVIKVNKIWNGGEGKEKPTPIVSCRIEYDNYRVSTYTSKEGINKDSEWIINSDTNWTYYLKTKGDKSSIKKLDCWEEDTKTFWSTDTEPYDENGNLQYQNTKKELTNNNEITFVNTYQEDFIKNTIIYAYILLKYDGITKDPMNDASFILSGTDYWGKEFADYQTNNYWEWGHPKEEHVFGAVGMEPLEESLTYNPVGYKVIENTPEGYFGISDYYTLKILKKQRYSTNYWNSLYGVLYDDKGNEIKTTSCHQGWFGPCPIIYNYPNYELKFRKLSADITDSEEEITSIPKLTINNDTYNDGRSYENVKEMKDVEFVLKGKTINEEEVEKTYTTDKDGYLIVDKLAPGEYDLIEYNSKKEEVATWVLKLDKEYKYDVYLKGSENYKNTSYDEENKVIYLWNEKKEEDKETIIDKIIDKIIPKKESKKDNKTTVQTGVNDYISNFVLYIGIIVLVLGIYSYGRVVFKKKYEK